MATCKYLALKHNFIVSLPTHDSRIIGLPALLAYHQLLFKYYDPKTDVWSAYWSRLFNWTPLIVSDVLLASFTWIN